VGKPEDGFQDRKVFAEIAWIAFSIEGSPLTGLGSGVFQEEDEIFFAHCA
jgi:hypothetical protein